MSSADYYEPSPETPETVDLDGQTLRVARIHRDTGVATPIGQLRYDRLNGQLRVLSAAKEDQRSLETILADLNRKPALFMEVPPAPGSPRFTVSKRRVERNSPDFLDAIKAFLDKYYDLTLT